MDRAGIFLIGLSLMWFFSTYLVFDGNRLTGFQRGFLGGAPTALIWIAAIGFYSLQGR